jgi:hypothetical protein
MSVENIIIYFLLPVLAWILIRINRIEKRIVVILVMLRDRGFRVPDKTDTEIFLKANDV